MLQLENRLLQEGRERTSDGIIELEGIGRTTSAVTSWRGTPPAWDGIENVRSSADRRRLLPGVGTYLLNVPPRRCRQVKDVEIAMNLGWAMPATGSALILRK